MKNIYKLLPKKSFFTSLSTTWMLLFFLLSNSFNAKAEGIHEVAPTSDDIVMLLIGDVNYGNFAVQGSSESSRLYIQFLNQGETLYMGLSRKYNANGNPVNSGSYSYVIKSATDNSIVHGPFNINNVTGNLSTWEDAIGPDVLTGGLGYNTNHDRYKFTPDEPGLYYVEFGNTNYIGLWDFTVANNNMEISGRVYSQNWAFRTPTADSNPAECVWDREFNGALYSYTSDGFVTRLDFANSGFQGLSFTMSFNSRGPGNSGDLEEDRKSISDANVNDEFAEHLVFLSEPDPILFPDGECGDITVAPYFQCVGENAYCLDVSVSEPGQLELVIDVNDNNIYDEGIDRRLFHRFNPGQSLDQCMYWDGFLGDGTTVGPGALVNLIVQYTQGIQHWSVFDGEFLKEGFCVQPIRPLCNPDGWTSALYWDDRNIEEDPGTGQPKDGTLGCYCDVDGCRTWNNFDPHDDDCQQINDNLTTGYGDKNIMNTWWFAHLEENRSANVPLVNVSIQGETEICDGSSTTLSFLFTSVSEIANIVWTGPQGVMAQGTDALTVEVEEIGIYTINITDVNGWSYTDTHELTSMACPTNLELDITVNDLTPEINDVVNFTITITNNGDIDAVGFQMMVYWDEAITDIQNITHQGVWDAASAVLWDNINLGAGQSIEIHFVANVITAFDYIISAEIVSFPQGDINSTPNNGVDTDNDGNCADDPGDEDDGDCVILSPASCAIQATITNVVCSPNGTTDIASDDTYTFDLTVTGSNGDESWAGELGGQAISGNYGQTQNFGPFNIADGNINVTVTDDFFSDCVASTTAQAPSSCSNQCTITLEEGTILCSDNGTNDNPTDDTYTVTFIINGLNTASTWLASDGSTGAYNIAQTYGPYPISDGDQTLTFTDSNDPLCSITYTFEAPASCSTNCSISTTVSTALCTDGGTPSDPSDDSFSFLLTVSGNNTSSGWTTDDIHTSQGVYNQAVLMGPYPISDGDASIVIRDNNNSACSSLINVAVPATCSNVCDIEASLTGAPICSNNDTPTDDSDDTYSFMMTVTGSNTASQWTASNGQTANYNEPTEIGPFPIVNGGVNITFTDADNNNCTTSLSVTAPQICSNTCDITTVDVTNILCDDNNTPTDPTDDTFTFSVRLEGFNLGETWMASSGQSGQYGENVGFGPYLVSEESIEINFTDSENGTCTVSVNVDAPQACSNQCAIEAAISNIECSDNGTPFDPGDDVFTFDLVVNSINQTGASWTSGAMSGLYGSVQVLGPFLIADGAFDLSIQDIDDASCSTIVEVTPPATCSNDCMLTIELISTDCDENNTALESDDDTFTYTILVNSLNGGTSWTASDGTTGNFGETVQSVTHAYSEGTITVTVTNEEGDCMGEFTVSPPEPNLSCPPDTDQQMVAGSVQILRGHLGDPDDLVISDIPCFAALRSTPMKLGDRFMEPVGVSTPEGENGAIGENVYTFYFFSNIEPSTGVTDYDGVGELFRGDYMNYSDPCCFNFGYPDTISNDINPIIENPYVDTTGMFGQEMHLVQRFSQSLKTGQEFSLVATTYGLEEEGDYAWVIVTEENDSMVVRSSNVTPSFMPNEGLALDLTYLDINSIMDDPIASQEYVGAPTVEPYCGVDSLFLNDNLNFTDSCSTAILERTYYLTYGDQIDSCTQMITFRRPEYDDIILPPSTYTIQCGDSIALNADGFPDPLETGYPLVYSGNEYIPLIEGIGYFNIGISYKDFPITDSLSNIYTIEREWYITDFCTGDTTYTIPQLIKIGEFDLPAIRCPLTDNCACPDVEADIMLFDVDPGECTATLEIPEPIITGFCDSSRIEDWYVVTELLTSDSIVIDSIFTENSDRFVANLERGDYLVRYSMVDDLNHRVERICRLRIADFQVPTAICKSSQTILLSELETTRIFPQDLDLGSYDNCDLPLMEVRRYFDQNALNCELLDEEGYGEWSPFVDFNCCDDGQIYTVQLRVMDADSNLNICNTLIEVIDDIAPQLYGLQDMQMSCSALPFNFDPTDSLSLIELFGYPEVDDNCLVETRTLEVELVWSDCDLGSIIRRFEATDRAGNTSSLYEQQIIIDSDNSYGIRFAADTSTDCLEAIAEPAFRSAGCGVFEMSFDDVELETIAGECRRIQRTYRIINTCDYDGVSDPVVISRNENCNEQEGEEDVWLVIENGSAFIDADSMANNAFPPAGEQGTDCTASTNPTGYWRNIDNVGYWAYTQIITIEDNVPPTIVYTAPEPYCTTDERCEGEVTMLLNIQDACLENQVDVNLWFDEDADGSLDEELTNTPTLTAVGADYTIKGDFPIGNHAFVLIAKDACDNQIEERINFSVVDCYVAQPICKTGLEVQLTPIVPAIDLDGDGIPDEGAYISAAALLAEEMSGDCSLDYTFSVNKINDTIDFANINLILTCNDRYVTTREIVVRDNAFNPYAVQPDGTIGGPNYSSCIIEISVQDELEVCSACADSELEIEGIIRNPENLPISDVEVRLLENDVFNGETFTIQDGKYEFSDLTFSTNFKVKPYKNDDIYNGVTTIDLIKLQKHLLLIDTITDPYVLLAADVNHSGTVTTLDFLILRNLLLGTINTFPNNTSWRFIPAAFPLTDIAADIPDSYAYVNLVSCQFGQDFTGIKIGDINGSASLSGGGSFTEEGKSRKAWPLIVDDLYMKKGDVYRIPIHLSEAQKASGLDINLFLDPSQLTVVEIEEGLMSKQDMMTQNLNRGLLKGLWIAPASLGDENTLMTLVVKAQKDIKLSDVLELSYTTNSTIYDQSLQPSSIEFVFTEDHHEGLLLLGNSPDPFHEFTEIEFYLPMPGQYLIEIHDVNGKRLKRIERKGFSGVQKFKITGDDLPTGVLFYTLIFNDKAISRRMIKQD